MKKTSFISIGLSFTLFSGFASGQTAWDAIHIFNGETGFGARALSMAGSYTAVANDYSAVYWNPAGLGQIEQSQFYTELSNLTYPNKATYMGNTNLDQRGYTHLRSFGLVSPIPVARGSLVFALGYNRIKDYDQNVLFSGMSAESNGLSFNISDGNGNAQDYPFDTNVYRQEDVSSEGGLGQWSLAGAVAVSPRVLLGATLGILTGKETYHFAFYQQDKNNVYSTYPANYFSYSLEQNLQNSISGLNLKLGALWSMTKWMQFGGTITLPSRVNINEVHTSNDNLVFDDNYSDKTSSSGEWSYQVRTPFVFDGGMAIRTPIFTVSTSVRYRDWSQTRFIVSGVHMNDQNYLDYLDENSVIATQYQPTTEIRAGGEIPLPFIGATLRGGIALIPDPLINKTPADYKIYSGGVSIKLDPDISLDITGNYSPQKRTTTDSYTPGGTTESVNKLLLQAGLNFKF